MELHEHLAAYGIVISGIWFTFAKAEQFIKPKRLKIFYYHIFVAPPQSRIRWPILVKLFVDNIFRFKKVKALYLPSYKIIAIYTAILRKF